MCLMLSDLFAVKANQAPGVEIVQVLGDVLISSDLIAECNEGVTMGHHPNSLRALREHGPKKGDAPRTRVVDPKTGEIYYANGWSKLRQKYRDRLAQDVDDLQDVLIAVAKTGDVQALRLALGPILNCGRLR